MKKERSDERKKQRWDKHWGNGGACSKKNGNSEKDSNCAARRPKFQCLFERCSKEHIMFKSICTGQSTFGKHSVFTLHSISIERCMLKRHITSTENILHSGFSKQCLNLKRFISKQCITKHCAFQTHCDSRKHCVLLKHCTFGTHCISIAYCISGTHCMDGTYCIGRAYCISGTHCLSVTYCQSETNCIDGAYCVSETHGERTSVDSRAIVGSRTIVGSRGIVSSRTIFGSRTRGGSRRAMGSRAA